MDKTFSDYGAWMNLLKGNYRKGAGSLRGILSTADTAQKLCADNTAVMAIYGDVDYTDGSCLCAKEIGGTAYAPDAFNHYLNLTGVSDYDSWAETAADLETLKAIAADEKLVAILKNSPALVVPKRTLEDDSWELISDIGQRGLHTILYSIGDTKDIELTDIGTMTMEIADFDHDYLAASTDADTAPITFLTRDLLYKTYQMSSANRNGGGFPSMPLRTTLNVTIFYALPSELKAVIQTAYKAYGKGNSSNDAAWAGMNLWVPLAWELFDDPSYAPTGERDTGNARKYPIFTDDASRVKKMSNGTGDAYMYYTATPANDSPEICLSVQNTGIQLHTHGTDSNLGVCFGFCV